MKNLLRMAAISVASVALVAGNATSATAVPGDNAVVTAATIQPSVLSGFASTSSTYIPGAFAYAAPGSTSTPYGLKATVNVNGVPVAYGVPISSNGFTYQRAWGAGAVTLNGFTLSGYDSRPVPNRGAYTDRPVAGASNTAQIRYGLDYRTEIRVNKRGKKLTFKVKARYINNAGRPVRVNKATVQVKKGSKWKTLKHVKLKKNGTGSFKKSDKKKRQYRLVIKQTGTYQGATLKLNRKI